MDFTTDQKIFYSDFARPFIVNDDELHTAFGLLKTADREEYEVAVISTHTLRYSVAVTLLVNDIVTIDNDDYRVIARPERINVRDVVAQLVKLP